MLKVRLLDPIDENAAKLQLYNTALATAICTMTEDRITKENTDKHITLIKNLINKNHTSVMEHIVYTFEITNISRALLQELSRHRMASPTVQSTRWALNKFNAQTNIEELVYIPEEIEESDKALYINSIIQLLILRQSFVKKYSNDIAKYLTPECVYTKEILTINSRSLSNMFWLRTDKKALKEFQFLMREIYNILPESHKFIYEKAIHN